MALDVVILGPPGAGKGTQAALVAADAGIPHVATGDMIRAIREQEGQLAQQVREVYDRGDLVSDELMIEIVRERLSQPDAEAGFVLDGFPRTLPQAEALDGLLAELDRELAVVLDFRLPEDVAVARLVGRAGEQGRADDTPDVIRHRLEVFREKTEPLVAYYRVKGILVGIHADRSVDDVFAEVQQVLASARRA